MMAARYAKFLAIVSILAIGVLCGDSRAMAQAQVGDMPAADDVPMPDVFTPTGHTIVGSSSTPAAADDSQGDGCCCNPCGPCGRFWFQADGLLWWTKGMRLPPLVTTSPEGTPAASAGVLGVPTTTILFGGDTVDGHDHAGVDVTMGMWFDCCNTWGIEGDYLDLGQEKASYDSGLSNGNPIFARPFHNTQLGVNDSELVAFPSLLAGRVAASASDDFQTAGLHFRHNLLCCENCCCDQGCGCQTGCCNSCGNSCCGSCWRVNMIGGYRYYNLSDDVTVQENLVTLTSPVETGTGINIIDSFRTQNCFNGGELGLIGDYYCGRWSFEASAKMSLGWNHEVVKINGGTVYTAPDGTETGYSGGLLALDTNIGDYCQNVFVVIPEFGLQASYQFTCCLRGFVGYDFLYWGQVARAGNEISLNVDPRNLPPVEQGAGPNPAFSFNQASFWAQGIRVGAELRF